MDDALNTIATICAEWNALKDKQAGRGGYLFDNKLYDLCFACDDEDDFNYAAEMVYDEWAETVREIAGYNPDKWDYNKYFEHDRHHGSYFNFRDFSEDSERLDFWANPVGLDWDATPGAAWEFSPFEKALNALYGVTRFSTDRLTPDEYTPEEIADITQNLTQYVIPALRRELAERMAVIAAYNDIKARQCEYMEVYI
ncbi:hypothetical protein FACS189499_03840 [Clostridia bacterium]|nr:hypothetical protein FACS189499_03840 [Clostridia bacterium]